MDDPFYSSKFSIDWAKEHFAEFGQEMQAFVDADNYSSVTEPDTNGTHNLLKLRFTKGITRALIGHVIDVVYNLRAALDQAIYSVAALHNTLGLSGFPSFCVRTDEAEFDRKFQGITGKFVPQEIADLVCGLQPYKGGNDVIWGLNKVCGCNKHGFIRPMPVTTRSIEISGTSKGGESPHIFFPPRWDSAKNEMTIAESLRGADFEIRFDYTFFVAFNDIEGLTGFPVDGTLVQFIDVVEGIVMAIEAESRRIGLL